MSQTVEERVARFDAEMNFNNSQFESAAQTSINTLGRLKEALNFKGAEKSFDDVISSFGLEIIQDYITLYKTRFPNLNDLGYLVTSTTYTNFTITIYIITTISN